MPILCPSELKGARVFITGGAGFLAANVVEALVEDCEIVALDNLRRNSAAYAPWRNHRHYDLVHGDVLDVGTVRICALGADYILHMAAIAGLPTVVFNPGLVLRTNMVGTMNVLDAVRREAPKCRRFIDFSTSEVYGPMVFRAHEDGMTSVGSLYEPRWFYAVSKLASEFLTRAAYVEGALPTLSIRPFNIYGPYQTGEGCVRNFVTAARTGRPLVVHGHGDQIRSWCYVDDMTRAILAAMTHPDAVGHVFNVGNPRATTSTLELANAVIRLTGSTSKIEYQEIEYPDVEVRVPSIKAATEHLGFHPLVNLEDGLKQTIAWWEGKDV